MLNNPTYQIFEIKSVLLFEKQINHNLRDKIKFKSHLKFRCFLDSWQFKINIEINSIKYHYVSQ